MTYALFYFKQGLLCQQLNEKPVLLLKKQYHAFLKILIVIFKIKPEIHDILINKKTPYFTI